MNGGRTRSKPQLDPFYVELGRRIGRERRRQNRTQEQLAEAIGLTRTSITNVERGRQKLLIDKVVQIAVVLHVDLKTLLPDPLKRPAALDHLEDAQVQILLRAVPEFSSKETS